ncbi:MAG: 3-deoxy-D-manno-octulosonic acid transferase [Muribaculaceae bacterium]|nr:3-deoxy-D-manno-octulosonic acid transferase [Muribaculaceae bacterium]
MLYNMGIALYGAVARIAATRSDKVRKMITGQKATLGYLHDVIDSSSTYIWIHVSSLGEFEQGRPLIEMIKRENPSRKILLTFFSPSGYEVRKNYEGVDAVCYLPFDTPGNARSFLDAVKVEMAIFVKYEFWGNYLQELSRKNIPTYLISSIFRAKQPFFKWWGGMFRGMLKCFKHIYVQDEASQQLLAGIGVENVTIAGDTRFDRVTDIMRTTTNLPLIERFKSDARHTIIVGSSWAADEDMYAQWVNAHDVKVIIAPHQFDKARLQSMLQRFNDSMLLSDYEKYADDAAEIKSVKCLIIDCFGLLSSIYRYGDIAYIGGGFGAGIHNINEAAVYDMPVVFGPKYHKFKEAVDLIALGGGFVVTGKEECEKTLSLLSSDTAALETASKIAGKYIKDNLGATQKIYNDLFA